jgi:hypothetical protein
MCSFFDTIGRKKMIAGTFAMSALLLLVTAYMFGAGLLFGNHSDDCLGRNILFCVSCRELCLPDCKRNLSA